MKKVAFLFFRLMESSRRLWLRLTGKTEEDYYNNQVVTGKAWARYCDRLKHAGAALVYPGAPQDPFQQAEGIRYLARLARAGLEGFLEFGDPAFPQFRSMVHETVKLGADNPDNHYLNATISGEYEYRIWGKRNSIHYFGLFTQNGSYGTTGGLQPCGVLEDDQLILEDDGSFEIMMSKAPKGKNWLKIEEESSLVMVRQTFYDRETEVPVEINIEAIGVAKKPPPLTPAKVVEGLEMAGLFTAGAPFLFARWARGFQQHTNQLPLFDPEVSNAAGGDARIAYYHSHWKLEKGQALVIEVMPPPCDTWNFQLNNYWMESLDYRYFTICINGSQAVKEPDGSLRVIVAHEDPGHPNWLETAGHTEGTMCWRWYRPEVAEPPQPATRVVDFAQYLNSEK